MNCHKLAYEIEFLDGEKVVVFDSTYSRAKVRAAWARLLKGAETYRQLCVTGGARRPECDLCKNVKETR